MRRGPASPAAVAAAGARHVHVAGGPCPNCAATLTGPYCATCGQKAEDFHRSVWRLVAEAVEGLSDFDGRFWNTLPRLILRPGQLTHDYLAGRRASQVPPFRMYLVTVILLLFAWGMNQNGGRPHYRLAAPTAAVATAARAKVEAARAARARASGRAVRDGPVQAWVRRRSAEATAHPDSFFGIMERLAEVSAVLMLPMVAATLAVLFALRRGVYVFDHLIFAMHSLSFLALLLTAVLLGGMLTTSAAWLLVAAPAHLFVHMRGVYRTGIVGTVLRMALLIAGLVLAFAIVLVAVVFISLAAVR